MHRFSLALLKAFWDYGNEPGPSFLGVYTKGGYPEQQGFWHFFRVRRQEQQAAAQKRSELAAARAYQLREKKEKAEQRKIEERRQLEAEKRRSENEKRRLEAERRKPPPLPEPTLAQEVGKLYRDLEDMSLQIGQLPLSPEEQEKIGQYMKQKLFRKLRGMIDES